MRTRPVGEAGCSVDLSTLDLGDLNIAVARPRVRADLAEARAELELCIAQLDAEVHAGCVA